MFSELLLIRREMQSIVDTLRGLGKLPSLDQAHQLFYRVLREKGFRAHQARQVYKYVLSIVKSARKNRGRKSAVSENYYSPRSLLALSS